MLIQTDEIGDRHNFGQSVRIIDNKYIAKPRPTIWEHLILDSRSRLRKLLDECDLFHVLPSLIVEPVYDYLFHARVERLHLVSMSSELRHKHEMVLGEGIGAIMALALWLGMSDLHIENILIGFHSGRLVIAPVDIECVFKKMAVPTATMLLPGKDLDPNDAGFSSLFEDMRNPNILAMMCYGYIQALKYLEANTAEAYSILGSIKGDLFSRVIIRSTRAYGKLLRRETSESDLIDAEREQLARRDIPYFFRRIQHRELLYFGFNKEVKQVKKTYLDRYILESQRLFRKNLGLNRQDFLDFFRFGLPSIVATLYRLRKLPKRSEHKGLLINHVHGYVDISFDRVSIRLRLNPTIGEKHV